MTVEQAVYYIIMLKLGFSEEFDAWLSRAQEEESPLSDLVLELSFCGSDVDCTASVLLNHVVVGKEPDYDRLETLFRLFLLQKYRNGASAEEITRFMNRINQVSFAHHYDHMFFSRPLCCLEYLEIGVVDDASFLGYLDLYLTEGIAPDPMGSKTSPQPSLWQRIRSWRKTGKERKNHENSR